MNPASLLIGIAAISFGIYTAYVRFTNPSRFGKLEAMQERWGDGTGTVIHTIAYTVVPIIVGLIALIRGLNGQSF